MTTTVEAVYEHGVLRLTESISLEEGTRVNVIIIAQERNGDTQEMVSSASEKPTALSRFIGAAKDGFTTSAEADAFIRRERDTWGACYDAEVRRSLAAR